MGDETIQFAFRFSSAVKQLALLSRDDAALVKRHGSDLAAVVREALDAVGEVYGTGTDAVRNWPEQRRRVLAQVATMRTTLDRSGVDGDLRRMARALMELMEPRSARR